MRQKDTQPYILSPRSSSSLPVILSLLLLWFALFIFFGILYVEIFGLTRWESAETHNENYTSLGRALVMLAFMSTGYVFVATRNRIFY